MKSIKFATQVEEKTLKKLKDFAAASDQNISKIVTKALEEYLQKYRVRSVFREAADDVISQNSDLLQRLAR